MKDMIIVVLGGLTIILTGVVVGLIFKLQSITACQSENKHIKIEQAGSNRVENVESVNETSLKVEENLSNTKIAFMMEEQIEENNDVAVRRKKRKNLEPTVIVVEKVGKTDIYEK